MQRTRVFKVEAPKPLTAMRKLTVGTKALFSGKRPLVEVSRAALEHGGLNEKERNRHLARLACAGFGEEAVRFLSKIEKGKLRKECLYKQEGETAQEKSSAIACISSGFRRDAGRKIRRHDILNGALTCVKWPATVLLMFKGWDWLARPLLDSLNISGSLPAYFISVYAGTAPIICLHSMISRTRRKLEMRHISELRGIADSARLLADEMPMDCRRAAGRIAEIAENRVRKLHPPSLVDWIKSTTTLYGLEVTVNTEAIRWSEIPHAPLPLGKSIRKARQAGVDAARAALPESDKKALPGQADVAPGTNGVP